MLAFKPYTVAMAALAAAAPAASACASWPPSLAQLTALAVRSCSGYPILLWSALQVHASSRLQLVKNSDWALQHILFAELLCPQS